MSWDAAHLGGVHAENSGPDHDMPKGLRVMLVHLRDCVLLQGVLCSEKVKAGKDGELQQRLPLEGPNLLDLGYCLK